jgi:hypothetical protein
MSEYGLTIPTDPNITQFSTEHQVQRVTVNEGFILVEDPVLGDYVVGDRQPIYYDLLTTPNAFRAGGISQLCKDEASSTIPNCADFTRQWHIFGLTGLVQKLAERQNLDPTQQLAYHLAAAGDDQAHFPFSHALETVIQSWGGPENRHEEIWPKVAELGGTSLVLRKHQVTVDQNVMIPGVELPDWITASAPNLNADRLQYGVTELMLWFDNEVSPPELRTRLDDLRSLDNIQITDDGQMVFTDIDAARLFAKGYLLLTTEHWNEPINRVQLHLLVQAAQRAIVERRISWMDRVDKRQTRRPDAYLHGIDQDIVDSMLTGPGKTDDFMHAVRSALYPIAMQERKTFVDYKQREYAAFLLDDQAHDYPSQYLHPKRVEFGPPASQVAISMRPANAEDRIAKLPLLDESIGQGVNYLLHPLKNRYVDPLVVGSPGELQRLSKIDRNYARLLEEQQTLQHMVTQVELAFAGEFEKVFRSGVRQNETRFNELKVAADMTDDQRRLAIELAADRARQLGIKSGRLVLKNSRW